MKNFSDLAERELLALAISHEEEDSRIYENFADGLREQYPSSAEVFLSMAAEENGHRHRLLDLYRQKFGDHIPLIRRVFRQRATIPPKPVLTPSADAMALPLWFIASSSVPRGS